MQSSGLPPRMATGCPLASPASLRSKLAWSSVDLRTTARRCIFWPHCYGVYTASLTCTMTFWGGQGVLCDVHRRVHLHACPAWPLILASRCSAPQDCDWLKYSRWCLTMHLTDLAHVLHTPNFVCVGSSGAMYCSVCHSSCVPVQWIAQEAQEVIATSYFARRRNCRMIGLRLHDGTDGTAAADQKRTQCQRHRPKMTRHAPLSVRCEYVYWFAKLFDTGDDNRNATCLLHWTFLFMVNKIDLFSRAMIL